MRGSRQQRGRCCTRKAPGRARRLKSTQRSPPLSVSFAYPGDTVVTALLYTMPPLSRQRRSGLCPMVRSSSALSTVAYSSPLTPVAANSSCLHTHTHVGKCQQAGVQKVALSERPVDRRHQPATAADAIKAALLQGVASIARSSTEEASQGRGGLSGRRRLGAEVRTAHPNPPVAPPS